MTDTELRQPAQAAMRPTTEEQWMQARLDLIAAANPAAISELLDRLEAAEKERDELRTELNEIRYGVAVAHDTIKVLRAESDTRKALIDTLRAENAKLHARIAEMEKQQEPLYLFRRKGLDEFCTCSKERYDELAQKEMFEVKMLYALPGARSQPAPSMPEVTDAMALAFHHALTDGSIGAREVEEIKDALRAALAAAPEAKP